MKKIIITGASGFVGQNLSLHLENQGFSIIRLSLRNNDWKNNIDRNAFAIIHLAGKAHDTSNDSKESEYFAINSYLTQSVYNEFLNSNIQQFYYFSSVKAVADHYDGVLDENVVPNPYTHYGKSKLEAERNIQSVELPEDKKLYIIRPCMIHGKGNKGNLNLLYKIVKLRIPWPLTRFDNKRSFLSIENLNYIIEKMLKSNIPSGIYNVADDEAISTNDLLRSINTAIGNKPFFLNIPKSFILFGAKFGNFFNLPLNSNRLNKLTENFVVSNEKIKDSLNINRLPLSAVEGIVKTIRSFNA